MISSRQTPPPSQRYFSFMKYRALFFAISLCVIVPGLVSLVIFRLQPSIDFTGGSLLEVQVKDAAKLRSVSREKMQSALKDTYELSSIQSSGDQRLLLRGKPLDNEAKNKVEAKLSELLGEVTEQRFETVGPILGRELIVKTLIAAAIVSTVITLFVGRQFKNLQFGAAAILAMFHDTLVLLGSFSLLGHFLHVEVDVLFVTALLTTLSFSVHDTIVVFDRIREIRRKHPRASFMQAVDAAVLETLGRSLNNSMTIIIMLFTLVLLGGETIRWFAVALLIGAVTGTYSSTFTAAPLLVLFEQLKKRQKLSK